MKKKETTYELIQRYKNINSIIYMYNIELESCRIKLAELAKGYEPAFLNNPSITEDEYSFLIIKEKSLSKQILSLKEELSELTPGEDLDLDCNSTITTFQNTHYLDSSLKVLGAEGSSLDLCYCVIM